MSFGTTGPPSLDTIASLVEGLRQRGVGVLLA